MMNDQEGIRGPEHRPKDGRSSRRWVLPLCVFMGSLLLLWLMVNLRRGPEPEELRRVFVPVETITVQLEEVTLGVRSQGVVTPRTETILIPEVSGRVEWISPNLADGGFFGRDEVLIQLDPLEYEVALVEREAALAQARLAYEQEAAWSAQARREWEDIGRGASNPLVLRTPQLALARANLEAAEAAVKMAARNLERTRIRAPYAGRVRAKMVDLGQTVVARTTQLARIYAVDWAEVRLPLALEELRHLEGDRGLLRKLDPGERGTRVRLTARLGGELHEWEGSVARLEGVLDERTRMAYVVAEVRDPFRADEDLVSPPLLVGQYVEAWIEGQRLTEAVRLPRSALRNGAEVQVVDSDNRLSRRHVNVVQFDRDTAIITGGLEGGERVSVTPLPFFVEGMEVLPSEIQDLPVEPLDTRERGPWR